MFAKRRDYFCILAILTINLCRKLCIGFEVDISEYDSSSKEFDVLIFTQRWPISGCIEWMNQGKDHVCVLPSQKDTWVIHGIWPTKFGTMGPFFCNSSMPFDINELQPLIDQLEQYWGNIQKGKSEDSLWRHEWEKHGTCAAILEILNNENRYFGQGLAWLNKFTMNSVLSKANIVPGSKFYVTDIQKAVKEGLNINPSIHCISDKHSSERQLAEIRICFSKTLELIDCDGVTQERELSIVGDGVITNCGHDQINYPSTLPQHLLEKSITTKSIWRFPWVNLYKLIEMIKWFTL